MVDSLATHWWPCWHSVHWQSFSLSFIQDYLWCFVWKGLLLAHVFDYFIPIGRTAWKGLRVLGLLEKMWRQRTDSEFQKVFTMARGSGLWCVSRCNLLAMVSLPCLSFCLLHVPDCHGHSLFATVRPKSNAFSCKLSWSWCFIIDDRKKLRIFKSYLKDVMF